MTAHKRIDRSASAETRFEEYLLRRTALDLEECERRLVEAVAEAVSRGVGWESVEALLGSAAPRARGIYSVLVERAS